MPELELSVVIPTRNRRPLLELLLDSLNRLAPAPKLEVIVVDNGSADDTMAALRQRQDAYELRVLSSPDAEGPAAARNLGAAASRAAIIGFLDSDVVVEPQWWQSAAAHFNDPQVGAVEGATLPPADAPMPTPFTHFVHNARGNSFQTCNLFCRRQAFVLTGGFDPRFGWKDRKGRIWYIREDTDLAFAILEAGFRIEFEPAARAIHPLVAAAWNTYWGKVYHGSREALLRRKHPRLYRERLNWINGRALPVFYWGVYVGGLLLLVGLAWSAPVIQWFGGAAWLGGWLGSVYAVCRKRRVRLMDLARLLPQYLLIPWMRLYWVLYGEWKFRKVPKGAVK